MPTDGTRRPGWANAPPDHGKGPEAGLRGEFRHRPGDEVAGRALFQGCAT